jgi:acetyltransferase-like isoleucine patch superfamily enzyme
MNRLHRFFIRQLRAAEQWYQTGLAEVQRHDDPRYQHNTIGKNVRMFNEVVLEGDTIIHDDAWLTGKVTFGRYSTLGFRSVLYGGTITIGRYCQFGWYVEVHAIDHVTQYVTTYQNRQLFEGRMKQLAPAETVTIGHDVWIGDRAIVLPSVNIGTGAIIGAGAVVTKDVPEYGIVVGSPARLVKKRFDDRVIEALLKWQWWQLSPAELAQHEAIFRVDLEKQPEALLEYVKHLPSVLP